MVVAIYKKVITEPIFPILFCVYPILFFYSHNADELDLSVLVSPTLIAIIMTTAFMLSLNLVMRNWYKTSMISLLVLAVFYLYIPLVNSFPHELLAINQLSVERGKVIMPATALVSAVFAWLIIKKYNPTSLKVVEYINLISIGLVVFTLAAIGVAEFTKDTQIVEAYENDGLQLSESVLGYKPDIYYLIFDRYAANKTLKELYDFDNTPFTNRLEALGFYVAYDSHANYPRTSLSLASSLNMDYLDHITDASNSYTANSQQIQKHFNHHRVGKSLKLAGYKYIHLGNWWGPTSKVAVADQNVHYKSDRLLQFDDFTNKFLQTTFYNVLSRHFDELLGVESFGEQHGNRALYSANMIDAMAGNAQSTLVISHMLMPHNPYVFDQACNLKERIGDVTSESKSEYIEQLKCTNRLAVDIIEGILKNSTRPPIIIVQADEGPWPHGSVMSTHTDFKNADDQAVLQRNRIMNAYYFPDGDYNTLYPEISPINSFRVVFNQFFNMELNMLPDKYYVFPDASREYEFIDVTQRVLNAESRLN